MNWHYKTNMMEQATDISPMTGYTPQHHPSEAMLMDHALGNLALGFSLAVDVHLDTCPQCQSDFRLMQELAGGLLADTAEQNLTSQDLSSLLDNLPAQEPAITNIDVEATDMPAHLAAHFRAANIDARTASGLPFVNRAPGIGTIPLVKDGDGTYARLMRIAAGKAVPHHSHHGLEVTALIKGCYEDEISWYGPGDFVEHGPEIRHQPIAGIEQDCICIGVTEGPLAFSNPLYRVLRPFFPV